MTLQRSLLWVAGLLLAPVVLAVLFVTIFGWNWLRGPIERMALDKTGRVLVIGGDLHVQPGWPSPHVRADGVGFANPPWATEKQMVATDRVDVAIDLLALLGRKIVLTDVSLTRPVVYLERSADGRKNWLLDMQQQDEGARIRIDRLTLDQGTLGFDDVAQKTRIRAQLSSLRSVPGSTASTGVEFTATGSYKALPLKAAGTGGPVLALRDIATPYPFKVNATIGHTGVRADGNITSLLQFTAAKLQLDLHGNSLEELYPLLGITFPATRAYATAGHLTHSGKNWRYERFSGRIGDSDIAGTVNVVTGGVRPALKAELTSKVLDIEDLGPMIGARPGAVAAAKASPAAQAHLLPELPLKSDRWNTVDADVSLSAATIRRAKELPLENLRTHLVLRDSVLTLDPLNFGMAGGQLETVITLDGRKSPIQAHARLRARKILLAKLFPTIPLNSHTIGQVNGEFDLSGSGNSVGRMLATSNGKVGLVVAGGQISQLMMEKAGLHLWEILQLNIGGDKLIKLRCGVAEFSVKQGLMQADALVFDTQVTTILGSGSIDLAHERLDLTLRQKTKNTSPLSLRSPIYVRGSFAKPEVGVDKAQVAVRALGALALSAINPFLLILPLVDAGPGADSDCGQLVRDARAVPHAPHASASAPRK